MRLLLKYLISTVTWQWVANRGVGFTIIAVLEVKKQIPVYNVHTPLYSARHEHNSLLQ